MPAVLFEPYNIYIVPEGIHDRLHGMNLTETSVADDDFRKRGKLLVAFRKVAQSPCHSFAHKCRVIRISKRHSDFITAVSVGDKYTVYTGYLTAHGIRSEHLTDIVDLYI